MPGLVAALVDALELKIEVRKEFWFDSGQNHKFCVARADRAARLQLYPVQYSLIRYADPMQRAAAFLFAVCLAIDARSLTIAPGTSATRPHPSRYQLASCHKSLSQPEICAVSLLPRAATRVRARMGWI